MDVSKIVQSLKSDEVIILNLTMMDVDQAQRSVDFVAGGTYCANGHQERIGESVFLFCPEGYKVYKFAL